MSKLRWAEVYMFLSLALELNIAAAADAPRVESVSWLLFWIIYLA